MVNATVADVIVTQATRALLASVKFLKRAVKQQTTLCATAEGHASVTVVNVMRDTSVHDARHALDAPTLARLKCKKSKFMLNFCFQIIITCVFFINELSSYLNCVLCY